MQQIQNKWKEQEKQKTTTRKKQINKCKQRYKHTMKQNVQRI